jgi:hypothetical protein
MNATFRSMSDLLWIRIEYTKGKAKLQVDGKLNVLAK